MSEEGKAYVLGFSPQVAAEVRELAGQYDWSPSQLVGEALGIMKMMLPELPLGHKLAVVTAKNKWQWDLLPPAEENAHILPPTPGQRLGARGEGQLAITFPPPVAAQIRGLAAEYGYPTIEELAGDSIALLKDALPDLKLGHKVALVTEENRWLRDVLRGVWRETHVPQAGGTTVEKVPGKAVDDLISRSIADLDFDPKNPDGGDKGRER